MASSVQSLLLLLALAHIILAFSYSSKASASSLSTNYYAKVCPDALPTIKRVVEEAIQQEKRMGASLLRLHFHDCFVHGCDGSILLDNTSTMASEKDALPNLNSVRGFNVVDKIKSAVDKACGRPTVSCADILAVAARDSVVALGGPTWEVLLGRRDSTAAYQDEANTDLPGFNLDLSGLITKFENKGLNERDLVALSGGHTIGYAKCATFKGHIYNDTNIDPVYAGNRKKTCPANDGDNNLAPLDPTAARFDTLYYSNLVKRRGLLHSDQALFNGGSTDALVKSYSANPTLFNQDFAASMIKMGKIGVLTGNNGQIRTNCRKIN